MMAVEEDFEPITKKAAKKKRRAESSDDEIEDFDVAAAKTNIKRSKTQDPGETFACIS
jgi:hypothetical protein